MQLALIILYSPIIINLAIILNISSEASLTPCRHAPFTRRAPAASTPTRRPRGRGDPPPPPAFFTSGPQRMGLTRVIDVNIFHGHWHHNTPGTAPCLAIPGKSITMYSRTSRPRDSRDAATSRERIQGAVTHAQLLPRLPELRVINSFKSHMNIFCIQVTMNAVFTCPVYFVLVKQDIFRFFSLVSRRRRRRELAA